MSYAVDILDPKKRAAEKQAARDADEKFLLAGKVSVAELARRNYFFSALPVERFRVVAIGKRRLNRAG
jgi:hypothetical protein